MDFNNHRDFGQSTLPGYDLSLWISLMRANPTIIPLIYTCFPKLKQPHLKFDQAPIDEIQPDDPYMYALISICWDWKNGNKFQPFKFDHATELDAWWRRYCYFSLSRYYNSIWPSIWVFACTNGLHFHTLSSSKNITMYIPDKKYVNVRLCPITIIS